MGVGRGPGGPPHSGRVEPVLLLGGRLVFGFAPGADLQSPADPAKVFGRKRCDGAAADHALSALDRLVRNEPRRLHSPDRDSRGRGGYDVWFLSFHGFFAAKPLSLVNPSVGRKSIGEGTIRAPTADLPPVFNNFRAREGSPWERRSPDRHLLPRERQRWDMTFDGVVPPQFISASRWRLRLEADLGLNCRYPVNTGRSGDRRSQRRCRVRFENRN